MLSDEASLVRDSHLSLMASTEGTGWPDLGGINPDPDGAAFILVQGEALLKAQVEGAERLQTRIAALMSHCVTLGSAALIAAATVFGLFGKLKGLVQQQPWSFGPPLALAGAVWLAGAVVAVTALQGVVLASPGKHPKSLYSQPFLEAGKLELTLFMLRVIGEAIEENQPAVDRLARTLKFTSNCLRLAPLLAVLLLACLLAWAPARRMLAGLA